MKSTTLLVGNVESVLSEMTGSFDTFCCYDVLEHLYDRAAALDGLRALAATDARLHVSVPNVRHYSLFRDLVVRGTFGYAPEGHRDVTHLRWFIRADMERLLRDCGWLPIETTTQSFPAVRRTIIRAPAGHARELFAVQWHILSRAG